MKSSYIKMIFIGLALLTLSINAFALQGEITSKQLKNKSILTVDEIGGKMNLTTTEGIILETKTLNQTQINELKAGNWACAASLGFTHPVEFISAEQHQVLMKDIQGKFVVLKDNLNGKIQATGQYYPSYQSNIASTTGRTISGTETIVSKESELLIENMTIQSGASATITGEQSIRIRQGNAFCPWKQSAYIYQSEEIGGRRNAF